MARRMIVSGSLDTSGNLRLAPLFVSDLIPDVEVKDRAPLEVRGTHRMTIEMIDDGGNVLSRHTVLASSICADPTGTASEILDISVVLPYAEATRLIRYVGEEGQLLLDQQVPSERPEPEITWRPRQDISGLQRVSWRVRPSAEYFCMLLYRNGAHQPWTPLCLPTRETSWMVDFDSLPGGDTCRLSILASSGVATGEAFSEEFLLPQKGTQVTILNPTTGCRIVGTGVLGVGQVRDLERHTFGGDLVLPEHGLR